MFSQLPFLLRGKFRLWWKYEPIVVGVKAGQVVPDEFLDGRDLECVRLAGETDRDAAGAGPAGAADAVHVVLGILGQGEIDHVAHVVDVDAAAGHVRGHQDPDGAGSELIECLDTPGLGHVPRQHRATDAVTPQEFGELSGLVAPVGEDHDPFRVLPVDQVEKEGKFLMGGDDVHALVDGIDRHMFGFDLDALGQARPLFRQPVHVGGQGGAEKQGLAPGLGGRAEHDAPDIGNESHVEHAVGLVDDQDLDLVQVDVLVLLEIEQPSGRSDDDVDRAFQVALLFPVVHSAEDGNGLQVHVLPQIVRVLLDLQCEFPGGGEDECPGRAGRPIGGRRVVKEPGKHGDEKCGGLAGAGLGLSLDIPAGQGDGQGLGLDGRAVLELEVGDRMEDRRGQVEVRKPGLALFRFHHVAGGVPVVPGGFGRGFRFLRGGLGVLVLGCAARAPASAPAAPSRLAGPLRLVATAGVLRGGRGLGVGIGRGTRLGVR